MMAFLIYQYLFGLLSNYRKQYPNKLLPAVYSLVFYHGKTTPYPYSQSLQSCFDDPLNIMSEVLYKDIALVDVNQLSDEVLKKQEWIGPVTSALKHIRQQEMAPFALEILSSLQWPMDKYEAQEMLELILNYLLSAGNIDDIDSFIESSIEQLSSPIRSEMMTFAEKMEERGIQKGKQEGKIEGKQDIALRMLNEGIDLAFISKVTDLSLADLKRLQEKNKR